MPCYRPLTGYRSKQRNANGKRPIVFNTNDGYADMPVELPCGRCVGCRLEYSRQWAVRCMHEAELHEQNAFITLTYNNENLPEDRSVSKDELQRFFKRCRKLLGNNSFRYFACGEYGDQSGRAHYHAIMFGHDFSQDRELHTVRNGNCLYRSPTLERLWPLGHSLIGDVTFQSCAYVARYVMKKRKGKDDQVDPNTGKTNSEYYEAMVEDTGEIINLEPEFCLMSRGSGRPGDSPTWRYGIGRGWLEKYKSDTDKDFVTVERQKYKLPKYYDSALTEADEIAMEKRKARRRKEAEKRAEDNTMERLAQREAVKKAQIQFLNRDI